MLVGLSSSQALQIRGGLAGTPFSLNPSSCVVHCSSARAKERSWPVGLLLLRKCRGSFFCSATNESFVSSSSSSYSSSSVAERSSGEFLDCVVVGGGISGLSIAQALLTKHRDAVGNVIVTESRDRVGGNITTVERDGYLWEEGPNSFQPNDAMLTLAVDCGLKEELVLGDPNAPRFVLWDGKLRPVPASPVDLPFFDLMSFVGKLRAGFGAIGLRPPPPNHEESVEEFVRRNLGDEVFERLIEPFCSGVYAGDPAKLSMKAAFGKVWKLEKNGGSIIGGTFKAIQDRRKNPPPPRDPRLPKPKGQTVGSFRKGLAMLPNAIAKRLGNKVKISWNLSSIRRLDGRGYVLSYDTPDGPTLLETKSVILTVPSYVASNILRPLSRFVGYGRTLQPALDHGVFDPVPQTVCDLQEVDTLAAAADALSKVYYPPVAAVTISYPENAIQQKCLINGEFKGFGQLHPRSQGVETLGTIYSSVLFPGRAPPGRILLLNYIGGATNTGILSKGEGELVETVDRDLRKMLIRKDAKDPLMIGVRVWPQAIPQFLVGHLDLLDAAKFALKEGGFSGLFLGGNYVSGVALGRCVEGAYESAAEVSSYLGTCVL